jgi:hypothetical protein
MRAGYGLLKGIVHVSFPGGGMFLPARTPYDRQTLVEHVKDRARTKGQVQVLADDRRWLVRFHDAVEAVCTACGHPSESSCKSGASGSEVCVTCAFGDYAPPDAASAA